MKTIPTFSLLCAILAVSTAGYALSDRALYGDPPDDAHPYAVHDMHRPVPKMVTPGAQPGQPSSDAVTLFSGSDASEWVSAKDGGPIKWKVADGALEAVTGTGDIQTKRTFGDCQLHVEWASPKVVEGESQGRGNSGVFLMGIYEVQVLDSSNNVTYPDGQAASLYGQHAPLVNVSRGPGEWQSYDIVFRRPVFEGDKVVSPATITIFQNGVLVQDHWVFEGATPHRKRSSYAAHPDKGPIKLQEHRNPTRFRNVWIRELEPKGDGGLEAPNVSKAAVAAKRKELAEQVKKEAEEILKKGDLRVGLLTLLESLEYVKDEAVIQKVQKLSAEYMAGVGKLDKAGLEAKKDELRQMAAGYEFLSKSGILPASFEPMVSLKAFLDKHGLAEKKK